MCFAVGLGKYLLNSALIIHLNHRFFIYNLKKYKGPVPFIYVAECFKQEARGAALSICMYNKEHEF